MGLLNTVTANEALQPPVTSDGVSVRECMVDNPEDDAESEQGSDSEAHHDADFRFWFDDGNEDVPLEIDVYDEL
ncbi:hypothetical protein A0H81_11149 [Grifola frondosa]|uniref:Uncharacterized protein n=1 Tax=Grifola frondosa TaxID=5627 RepID=A0A1C7LW16_GRIFR|nr:hypothetical protein A0H81_11149 [Grifola frondosa]